jgi:methionyl-tRNA formyltransferase
MKIVFFWTWEFSAQILEGLKKYDIEVSLVISQPDRPVWRGNHIVETPVKKYALSQGFQVLQPETLKENESFLENLKYKDADFFVVVAYGKILPKSIISIPKYYTINIHGSLLPSYRWASPIQESIKNGDNETWLTIMEVVSKMDAWGSFKQEKIDIDIMDNTLSIFKKMAQIWPSLLNNTLMQIMQWGLKPVPQDQTLVTYCSKIDKEDWRADFQKFTAKELYNRFKAYTPWPWLYTTSEGKKLGIEDCFYDESVSWQAGMILKNFNSKEVSIYCREWALILKQVKPEWKKQMDILSFLNGKKNIAILWD